MQKTKKITWQAIAIAVLSLLLVLALALGISGAWFQDNKTGTANVTLGGAVTFTLKEGGTEFTTKTLPALPGTEIFKTVTLTAKEGSSNMLFRVKVDVNFTNGDFAEGATYAGQAKTAMGIDENKWKLGTDGYYYYTNGSTDYAAEVAANASVALTTKALVCPTTWTNAVANQPFTITITAEAIQAANGAATLEGWEFDAAPAE